MASYDEAFERHLICFYWINVTEFQLTWRVNETNQTASLKNVWIMTEQQTGNCSLPPKQRI